MKYVQLICSLTFFITDTLASESKDRKNNLKFYKPIPKLSCEFYKFPEHIRNDKAEKFLLSKNNATLNKYLEDKKYVLDAFDNLRKANELSIYGKKQIISTFCYDYHRTDSQEIKDDALIIYNGLNEFNAKASDIIKKINIEIPEYNLDDDLGSFKYINALSKYFKYYINNIPYAEISSKLIKDLKALRNNKLTDLVMDLDTKLQELSAYYSKLSEKIQTTSTLEEAITAIFSDKVKQDLNNLKTELDTKFMEIIEFIDTKDKEFEVNDIINSYLIIGSCHDYLKAISDYNQTEKNAEKRLVYTHEFQKCINNLTINIFMGLIRKKDSKDIYKNFFESINNDKFKEFFYNNIFSKYFSITFYNKFQNDDSIEKQLPYALEYIESRLSFNNLQNTLIILNRIEEDMIEDKIFKEKNISADDIKKLKTYFLQKIAILKDKIKNGTKNRKIIAEQTAKDKVESEASSTSSIGKNMDAISELNQKANENVFQEAENQAAVDSLKRIKRKNNILTILSIFGIITAVIVTAIFIKIYKIDNVKVIHEKEKKEIIESNQNLKHI